MLTVFLTGCRVLLRRQPGQIQLRNTKLAKQNPSQSFGRLHFVNKRGRDRFENSLNAFFYNWRNMHESSTADWGRMQCIERCMHKDYLKAFCVFEVVYSHHESCQSLKKLHPTVTEQMRFYDLKGDTIKDRLPHMTGRAYMLRIALV